MFTVNIASIAPWGDDDATLTMQSGVLAGGTVQESFPPSGGTSSNGFEVNGIESFDLECRVSMGQDSLTFFFSGLGSGDTLNIVRHGGTAFTATIFHSADHPSNATCTATCKDGTQAQGCVVCRSGTLTGKICC